MIDIEYQDWRLRNADKVRTAGEALARIADGQRVFVGSGAAVPQTLVEALAERSDLSDVEITHILTLAHAPYTAPHLGESFRHNALFIGANVREAVGEGRADCTSIFLHEIPALFRTRRQVLDVAIISVSPPDRFGYCSYGVSCDVVRSAAESARCVIAEVNERMPRMLGDCFIHVDRIDALVPSNREIIEAPQAKIDDVSARIGRHIATLLEDGCTLQMGIGGIPDAVLHNLDQFKDLGVHTEMFSDGVIPLIEKGVITNAAKSLHPGLIVCSFVMGSRKLYDFVNDNPMVSCHPTEYTNDPFIVAKNDKMVAINAALEIDLTGQVCADSLGTNFFSGFGGQVDFIRGAARSKGGRPIIAMPSTAAGGKVSRIAPHLKVGAGVVTGRADVHFVVTEYGVAYLHGKNARERALSLIQIAHPDFREWLIEEARNRNLIPHTQVATSARRPTYREDLESLIQLNDGAELFIRPLRLTDESLMRDLLYRLSPEMQEDPFFKMHFASASDRLDEFLKHHYGADLTLAVLSDATENGQLLSLGHYSRNTATNFADAGILVREDWQNRGIGTALLQRLIDIAIENGVGGFETTLPAYGARLLQALYNSGFEVETETRESSFHLKIPFARRQLQR